MRHRKTFLALVTLFILSGAIPAMAQEEPLIQTSAKQAYMIDYDTGAILLEKNANEHMPTSSMSKVMTLYVVFETLKKGQFTLDDKFLVSEEAWRKGGSKMFVEVDKKVPVRDLIQGVAVQSGNDAAIVLAEGVAGSEEAFALALNEKAAELGMSESHFVNASGWPDPNHYSTAKDLTTLGADIIREFPDYYKYFAEKEYTYNSIKQPNRNPLLFRNDGADGIKTGHTEAAGFGLMGSGVFEGRRVVFTLNGMDSMRDRAEEGARILNFGLKRFENLDLFATDEPVTKVAVARGQTAELALVTQSDLKVTVPKISKKDFTVEVDVIQPLVAPIAKGDQIGTLIIDVPHMQRIEKPLYASTDVPAKGFVGQTVDKLKSYF